MVHTALFAINDLPDLDPGHRKQKNYVAKCSLWTNKLTDLGDGLGFDAFRRSE